jgi:hypothetical protein
MSHIHACDARFESKALRLLHLHAIAVGEDNVDEPL